MSDRIEFDGEELDEVVLAGEAHFERCSDSMVFLSLRKRDGSSLAIWISAMKGPLRITHEPRDNFDISRPSPPNE